MPSGPTDGINPYVFPLTIKLAKVEKLALAPIFLGSLFFNLDECAQNLLKIYGPVYNRLIHRHCVSSIDFVGEIMGFAPQQAQFEALNIVTVEDENAIVKSVHDKPEKMRA